MKTNEEQLREAFMAGFDASGEGWNGEFFPKGKKANKALEQSFEEWLTGHNYKN